MFRLGTIKKNGWWQWNAQACICPGVKSRNTGWFNADFCCMLIGVGSYWRNEMTKRLVPGYQKVLASFTQSRESIKRRRPYTSGQYKATKTKNICLVYLDQGKDKEAEAMYQQALQCYEQD
ncbi:uncharacterized protein PpBr36_05795 [Pyricularia pennisetigena]|uniref:uncharacterized protein n=1 Tax=Pyricularia pennisetigena TaxID=1578925 RepID=UPI00114FBA51|nr:uncharacterized protein PpBr36_05795 [Pyricularia pennisetigena]TLS22853.1 hypothetical protein PpBr36_05795 [Pyricularia pennisetigena]